MRRPRKPRLVDEWRRAHRMLSVQLAALFTVFGLMPVDQQTAVLRLLHIPQDSVTAVMGLLFIGARLLAQGKEP